MSTDVIFKAGAVQASLQVLTDKLASWAVDEISLILFPDQEVSRLQRSLERIRAIVARIEENLSISSNNFSNEAWEKWLVDADKTLYSADDMLDEILLEVEKYKANLSADANGYNQVRDMLLSSFKLAKPHNLHSIRQELDDLEKEMDTFLLIDELAKSRLNDWKSTSHSRTISSVVEEGSVLGREREKNEIVEMLLAEDLGEGNVSVIPIVGMGGIGKTTLARVAYGDDMVVNNFELKMWVSVSVNFNTINITKSLIESAMGKRCKLSQLDAIQIQLQNFIRRKKFLLVLDDYWNEEYDDWDILSLPLKVGSKGSKIIVTTRSMIVSRILGTVPSYCLDYLSDEDCWRLMRRRAFSRTTLENGLELEEIGMVIARKCEGLPLAAKALGNILHSKDDIAEWKSVLESEILELPHGKKLIFSSLSLSYYHLPVHLKNCFGYCSVFLNNHEFDMDELGLMWIAQGFVRGGGRKQLEEVANNYFKDLVSRSFFKFSHQNDNGRSIYKMHDLIRSMAQLVSSAHRYHHQDDDELTEVRPLQRNTRHVFFHYNHVRPVILTGSNWYKKLRTFSVLSETLGQVLVSEDLFPKLESCRVLLLRCLGLQELPSSINHMKHLRYLDLCGNRFKKLPATVTDLFGLQTLNLEQCDELLELPKTMKNMICLRHLCFNAERLLCMPPEFGKLVNIQTLSAFIVGTSEGCSIGELKNLRLLRGSICLKNLENVQNIDEAKEAMLDKKPFLDRLVLEWSDSRSRSNDEEVLAGLRPHENLKELLIRNYRGNLLPGWFTSPLCKLFSIHLENCKSYQILVLLGRIECLKHLVIKGMNLCFDIDIEASTFASLESLKIEDMPNLETWEGFHEGSFPRLRILEIEDCPKLINLPSLVSTTRLECLKISLCPRIGSLPDPSLPISLQELTISECDVLKDRCRRDDGEEWDKIRLVSKIKIDDVEI